MLFHGSAAGEEAASALALVRAHRQLFDDRNACFFGVTTNPSHVGHGRIAQELPGIRHFLDYDGSVSRQYGAMSEAGYNPHWLLLDARLRVVQRFPLSAGATAIDTLRAASRSTASESWAPVLLVPNILEPQLCSALVAMHKRHGGTESGFMREIGGRTTLVTDVSHKQRRDFEIREPQVRQAVANRLVARLKPAISQAFQFAPTRIERYLVACYEAGAGYFRPHRDNTTKGTAHRRFAVTINLNAGSYDGGDLRFPEFGMNSYCASTGGAIVFSCSLLHEAMPVTRGKRYAFLPFLYDEAGARERDANNHHLAPGVSAYHP